MLKVNFKSSAGDEVIDFADDENKIENSIYKFSKGKTINELKIGDLKHEKTYGNFYSDSEFGKGIIKLIKNDMTIKEIINLENELKKLSESMFNADDYIESMVLHEQYSNIDELYSDIKDMEYYYDEKYKIYYFPLSGTVFDERNNKKFRADNKLIYENKETIYGYLEDEQNEYQDMSENIGKYVNNKLKDISWMLESIDGRVYGRINCRFIEPLTTEEEKKLMTVIKEENQNGIGNSFNDINIDTDKGWLNVLFCNENDEYIIYTEEELNEILFDNKEMALSEMK